MNDVLFSFVAGWNWHAFSMHWILTLAHFLWQGAAIGLLATMSLSLCRRSSSRIRHGICLTALTSCLPCVVATWMLMDVDRYSKSISVSDTVVVSATDWRSERIASPLRMPEERELPESRQPNSLPVIRDMNLSESSPRVASNVTATTPSTSASVFDRAAPLLAIGYFLGVFALLCRTTCGLWGGRQLRNLSQQVVDSDLLALIEQQAHRIGLKSVPVVAYCSRVDVPTVIGLLKPIVLLPASLITSLDPDQLAAILSHEFAHIRRLDLFVNLLQRVIESLLFFHPVVWWLSRRISIERENCCDDQAAASGIGNLQYAGALLRMAELSLPARDKRFASQVMALSADGQNASHLSRRIERLLEIPQAPRLAVSNTSAVFALMLSVISVGVLAQIADKEPADETPVVDGNDEPAAGEEQQTPANVTLADLQLSERVLVSEEVARVKPTAPPKGLEFLKPYPELHELSLEMTEVEFLSISQREKLKIQTSEDRETYFIPTGDGHTVIVMFGNNGDKCSGIQRIHGEHNTGEAEIPKYIIDQNGIYWSNRVLDGFRVGAKLRVNEDQVKSGERLVVHYVLKNETEQEKSVKIDSGDPLYPCLEAGNVILFDFSPMKQEPATWTLRPGEILQNAAHRAGVDTTGLPSGEYRVIARNFYWKAEPENPESGLPTHCSYIELPLTISPAAGREREPGGIGHPSDEIDWGKQVAGLEVGTRFLVNNTLFEPGSSPKMQLFVRNITTSPIEIEVMLPHPADGWLINVENPNGDNILLERTPIDIASPEQSFKLKLEAGETRPLTGVKQSVNGGTSEIKNSRFRIESKKPDEMSWTEGILVSQGGHYGATHTVTMKRSGIPGLRLNIDSGKSMFQVSGPELAKPARPVSLHGFDLSPFRSSKPLREFEKTEPLFDRERSLTEGGSWRCWVDSAQNYSQWLVHYAPRRNTFFVIDQKSEPKLVYGPISGDAIVKLHLLDRSSDLVKSNPDEQNKRRAAGEHERRVGALLESSDNSLRAHGLSAVVELGDLGIFELKKWTSLVVAISNSKAGRGELKTLAENAERYIKRQHDRNEAKRVQLDDSEYWLGRKPTPAELELPWEPVTDGLSLAVSGWTEELRLFDVKDRVQVEYLVRNMGDSPRRVSTLNVLDGVGTTVTDEQSKISARLGFGSLSGIPLTERYLMQPGEVITIKKFSFEIREGDLLPPGKAFNPKNLEITHGYINLRPNRIYHIDFSLWLPSAYSEDSKSQITMPAKGEFDGQLVATPLHLALRNKNDEGEKTPSASETKPSVNVAESSPIRLWKGKLIDGMTGKPLPGVVVRVNGSVTGNPESQPIELVSSGQGIFTVPLRDGTMTSVDVQTQEWWSGPYQLIGQPPSNPNQPLPKPEPLDPKTPREIKLWPGEVVIGKLLYPDKSPAAGVRLNVGVYINHQEWKKRLGMDLGFYSWDHGEWPNWSRAILTDDDGSFTTTVPPASSRSWVRVGTTGLGFGSIKPEQFDAEGTGGELATCVPFEADLGGNDPGYGYKIDENRPLAGSDEESLNFGTIQMQVGIRVRGRVVDAEGKGLEGVYLATAGRHGPYAGRSTWSGEDGRFEFLPVEPGSLIIKPDARLRDVDRMVISRDVQAVFIEREYVTPTDTFELVVQAVPHVELEFEWIDRRADKTAPVSFYGEFKVVGHYPLLEEERAYWHGETRLIERDGKKVLTVKVPRQLINPTLILPQDTVVKASYEDETGTTSGPGRIELGDIAQPIRRTIYGDEPLRQN